MNLKTNKEFIKVTKLQTESEIETKTKAPKFYNQIDGLRCFCVLGVLVQHYIDPNLTKYFYTANIGVDLFFVISGFLITEILINLKKSHTFKNALYVFYSRRILRIFPLYYFYWLLLVVFYYPQIKESLAWGLLYVYNFYSIDNENIAFAGHLWSLAVEEQFYMVWPLIVMLVPLKRLKITILGLLGLSVLFLLMNFKKDSYSFTYHHTLTCAVSLLTGAFLAYLKKENTVALVKTLPKLWWTVLLGFIGCLALCVLVANKSLGQGYLIFIRFFVCIAGFYVIGKMALLPFKGITAKIFESKIAKGIGRISYGIYIYHMLVFFLMAPLVNKLFTKAFENQLFENGPLRYIKYNPSIFKMPVYAVIVIAVSWLSFVLFEKRFLNMKRLFQ